MQVANLESDIPIPLPMLSLSLHIVEVNVRGGENSKTEDDKGS